MKVLNISLDKNIANQNSAVAKRVANYGSIVDSLAVIVIGDKDVEFNLADNIKVVVIQASNKITALLRLKKKAREILTTEKYDVLTVQDAYYVGMVAVGLAKKFKIALEVQVHGFEKLTFIRRYLAKKVLAKAKAIRVVSQRLKIKLIKEFKVDENVITIVPIYVDVAVETGSLSKLEMTERNDNNKFIFLTIGRLVSVKNIAMQIKVVKKLNSSKLKVSSIELWIVGSGPEKAKLEKLCYSLDVTRYVKFFGAQQDIDKFCSKADVFLLTSSSEGWGMVVVEAARHGLPIIMTDVGLAGEVIKNDTSGLVIPVGDEVALEKAMSRLLQDKDLRNRLGKNAREVIKKLPSKDKTLNLMKQSWEKAIHPVK